MANGPQSVAFDLLNSPCDGTNLIEASAGTGKTYAIAGLFLRLLLEQDLLVNEILVVTFTDAATNELKERIQRRLREALAWISGDGPADPFLAALCSRQPPAGHASRRLRGALNDFDQASIFTIHGFCQRVLRDHAFESGMMFDADLVADQERFVREIVHDFWRNHYRKREVSLSSLTEDHQGWLDVLLADDSREIFERQAAQRAAREVLEYEPDRLSADDRMIVTLMHLDGLSVRETADLLGWSSVRVKVRAHRSRQRMKKIIMELLEEGRKTSNEGTS